MPRSHVMACVTSGQRTCLLLAAAMMALLVDSVASARCSGQTLLTTAEGSFGVENYGNGMSCSWLIELPDTGRVVLHFEKFDVESADGECPFDKVAVLDGSESTAPSLAELCGNELPADILARGSSILVVFSSDSTRTGPGFWATYTTKPGVLCSGRTVLTAAEDSFGVDNYANDMSCEWLINLRVEGRVVLHFEKFDLESADGECPLDKVTIFDGSDSTDRTLATLCGNKLPADVVSSYSTLLVVFSSDSTRTAPGFWATYTTKPEVLCSGLTVLTTPEASFGVDNYINDMSCEWLIQLPVDGRVQLHFEKFAVEDVVERCPFDKVTVFDGSNTTAPMLARLCGNELPGDIVSSRQSLLVLFSTDSSRTSAGFWASYAVIRNGTCSERVVLSNRTGTFGVGRYEYVNNMRCEWLILAPQKKRVTLHFVIFDVEAGGTECSKDKVTIFDGSEISTPVLGSFCGNQLPRNITTKQNAALVTFSADSEIAASGFWVQYFIHIEGCSSSPVVVDSVDGNFGVSDYENDMSCVWLIKTQSNQKISLDFLSFDLEDSPGCTNDRVMVFDGDSASAPLLQTLCGSTVPSDIVSSGAALFVTFETNGLVTKTGFSVNTSEELRCFECGQSDSKSLREESAVGLLLEADVWDNTVSCPEKGDKTHTVGCKGSCWVYRRERGDHVTFLRGCFNSIDCENFKYQTCRLRGSTNAMTCYKCCTNSLCNSFLPGLNLTTSDASMPPVSNVFVLSLVVIALCNSKTYMLFNT